ncbi:MAG: RNA polymerase sporulation sigma factor SigK [Clostridia bacterium]|nr:RNA polymerase sporulation sigma factor SigK [Clostridia bacterium]MCI9459733.1 RNA polymerase sporulation sigma factor SigK [Clostridia bacterium]
MIIESFMTFLSRIFFFTSFVNNNGSFPKPLKPEEERAYFDKYKSGDKSAYDILVRHNLRLVAHIVKKYNNAGEADDLISVGTIGLIKGIETFSPDKGCQLTTYAAKCIENEILMYIRANKKHRQAVSLFEPVGSDKDGNDIALMDVIPQTEDGFEAIENGIVLEKVKSLVKEVLDETEKDVIELRYGLIDGNSMTQAQVAKHLNISRSYVSRIEKRAIEKVSEALL